MLGILTKQFSLRNLLIEFLVELVLYKRPADLGGWTCDALQVIRLFIELLLSGPHCLGQGGRALVVEPRRQGLQHVSEEYSSIAGAQDAHGRDGYSHRLRVQGRGEVRGPGPHSSFRRGSPCFTLVCLDSTHIVEFRLAVPQAKALVVLQLVDPLVSKPPVA